MTSQGAKPQLVVTDRQSILERARERKHGKWIERILIQCRKTLTGVGFKEFKDISEQIRNLPARSALHKLYLGIQDAALMLLDLVPVPTAVSTRVGALESGTVQPAAEETAERLAAESAPGGAVSMTASQADSSISGSSDAVPSTSSSPGSRSSPLSELAIERLIGMVADGDVRFRELSRDHQETIMSSAQFQQRFPQMALPVPTAAAEEGRPRCFCELPVALHTATGSSRHRVNPANIGRKFWRCPRPCAEQCQYFMWQDTDGPPPPAPQHHTRLTVRHRKSAANNAAASAGGESAEKAVVLNTEPGFDILVPNRIALFCGAKTGREKCRVQGCWQNASSSDHRRFWDYRHDGRPRHSPGPKVGGRFQPGLRLFGGVK